MLAFIKFLSFLCLLLTPSLCQNMEEVEAYDENEYYYEEETEVVSSPDVTTSSVFPRYTANALPLGKPLEVIFGFFTQGEHTFNITDYYGSLLHPQDPSVYLQNFTATRRKHQIVRGGERWTFNYWFYPDSLLEAGNYLFLGVVEYRDEDNMNYSSTFYNGTILLVNDGSSLDYQYIFTQTLIYVLLIGGGYYVWKNHGSKAPVKYNNSRVDGNDWNSNAVTQQFNQQKKRKGK
eukprot:TRINITY_DN162_c0_g1_i2.p1 TRINITY_DN162_c0_g1~~TRINITY_DN162_c0_g1_i2.p1  ORF type:complete len:234 (-),score=41.39 TRINITY_DN162_c0_g1_i2:142-843(-)